MKKLYKSRQNRMLSGVCGGIGEYLEIDPTIIRILFVIIFGLSIWVYLFLALIIPYEY